MVSGTDVRDSAATSVRPVREDDDQRRTEALIRWLPYRNSTKRICGRFPTSWGIRARDRPGPRLGGSCGSVANRRMKAVAFRNTNARQRSDVPALEGPLASCSPQGHFRWLLRPCGGHKLLITLVTRCYLLCCWHRFERFLAGLQACVFYKLRVVNTVNRSGRTIQLSTK